MKENSKIFIFAFISVVLLSLLSTNTIEAKEKKSQTIEKIPAYPGSIYIKTSPQKKDTQLKEYCSKDPAKFIKKYYKRKYPHAIELTVGTKKGDLEKLLFDVKSPLQRSKSKQSVNMLSTNKKGKCRTRIWIEDYAEESVKKREKKPSGTKEAIKKTKPVKVAKEKKPGKITEKRKPTKAPAGAIPSRNIMGIGAAVNTVNTSSGGSLILWPHPSFGIQANYGVGEFTSYEAKFFYKINLDYPVKPYFGGGYIHAEKDATILGEEVTIEDDSYSIFAGLEYKLSNSFSFYLDVAGTPLKLEDEFLIGATNVIAEVDYSPATVNLNMVYYFW